MATPIIALEKDLFFSVKIRDTLRHHDMAVTVVRNLATFEQALANESAKPALAIINISMQGVDWEAAIKSAGAQHIPTLAFGSHIDLDAQTRARQAGARRVVANSKFARDMPDLVQRTLHMSAEAAPVIDASETDEE